MALTQLNHLRIAALHRDVAENYIAIAAEWDKLYNVDLRAASVARPILEVLQGIECGFKADRANSFARLENDLLSTTRASLLSPLRDIRTNIPIQDFPRTVRDLDGLTEAGIDRLLTALGVSAEGEVGEKKIRLKLCVGLTRMCQQDRGSGVIYVEEPPTHGS